MDRANPFGARGRADLGPEEGNGRTGTEGRGGRLGAEGFGGRSGAVEYWGRASDWPQWALGGPRLGPSCWSFLLIYFVKYS